MTRLHHPGSIPGLLSIPQITGTPLVLDADGNILLGNGGKEAYATGLLEGGTLSFSGTEVTAAAGKGVIVDSYTTPGVPVITEVEWAEQTVDPGSVTTRSRSWIYVDANGVVQFSTDQGTTPVDWRERIHLGFAAHDYADTGDVLGVNDLHNIPGQSAYMLIDEIFATSEVPFLLPNSGDVVPNANLTYDVAEQQWFAPGVSSNVFPDSPNFKVVAALTPASFWYIDALGAAVYSAEQTLVDPTNYEPTPGTVSAVPGAGKTATIQRIYLSLAGLTGMQYGQQTYADLNTAVAQLRTDIAAFTEPEVLGFSTLVAYVVVEKAATDLSNGADVIILDADGIPIGGGGSVEGPFVPLDGSIPMTGALTISAGNTTRALAIDRPDSPVIEWYMGDNSVGQFAFRYTAGGGGGGWFLLFDGAVGVARFDKSVEFISGSAAMPGIAFVGDTDTGFARESANRIAAVTKGTVQLRIKSSDETSAPVSMVTGSTGNAGNMYLVSSLNAFGVALSTSKGEHKKDIATIELDEARRIISALNPVQFHSKHENDSDDWFNGFVYEQAAEVSEALSADDHNNYDIRAIVANLTRVVQGLLDSEGRVKP